MFLSVFDVFKIGIGPSSSHTMGPMTAAARALAALRGGAVDPARLAALRVSLHGSLAFTGKGHATDRAVLLGLMGFEPASLDPDAAKAALDALAREKCIRADDLPPLAFDPDSDLVFDHGPPLPLHANGLVFEARDATGAVVWAETYFSTGGGFVQTEAELTAQQAAPAPDLGDEKRAAGFPYPFGTAAEMLAMGARSGLSIAEMKRANELSAMDADALTAGLARLWSVMDGCIDRGLDREGVLPGGLMVKRRAAAIARRLEAGAAAGQQPPWTSNDWLSVWAMAVNEENAAGGRVVTAPTNGAAGVVPATLRYYRNLCGGTPEGIETFLLVAAAIGGLIKFNASISGAELGCQAEIGSAAAMAAAGLCAALGGSNAQVENAAEIALEHHLGLTCDPVRGLVQVPCIERNGLGAIKAVAAASLALHGDGAHFMPLDNCIETMRQTGADMGTHYKETSLGGLAVNLPEC